MHLFDLRGIQLLICGYSIEFVIYTRVTDKHYYACPKEARVQGGGERLLFMLSYISQRVLYIANLL